MIQYFVSCFNDVFIALTFHCSDQIKQTIGRLLVIPFSGLQYLDAQYDLNNVRLNRYIVDFLFLANVYYLGSFKAFMYCMCRYECILNCITSGKTVLQI